jgi:hypothetical protein
MREYATATKHAIITAITGEMGQLENGYEIKLAGNAVCGVLGWGVVFLCY